MDERIWALPGPRTLITDTLREIQHRRHVCVVLPSVMATDPVTDGLASMLVDESNRTVRTVRVPADPDAHSLLDLLSSGIVYDDPPATVPTLLSHREAADTIAVIVAAELSQAQQSEFPALLQRIERETHALTAEDRLTVAVIGSHQHLPHFAGGETSDVSLTSVWWWNRIARWDVAAHISQVDIRADEPRILADIRSETIVEVARWDLDLAEKLVRSWSGDPEELPGFLDREDRGTVPDNAEECGQQPETALLEAWERGDIDGWHDAHAISAAALSRDPRRIERLVWAAQARMVLPWIEENRQLVQQRTVDRMTRKRFQSAMAALFEPALTNTDLVEIGPLKRIIDIRLGNSDPKLRSAAVRLYNARNDLAHLRPLKYGELRELVAACRDLS